MIYRAPGDRRAIQIHANRYTFTASGDHFG